MKIKSLFASAALVLMLGQFFLPANANTPPTTPPGGDFLEIFVTVSADLIPRGGLKFNVYLNNNPTPVGSGDIVKGEGQATISNPVPGDTVTVKLVPGDRSKSIKLGDTIPSMLKFDFKGYRFR